MARPSVRQLLYQIPRLFRGLANVADFLAQAALAVIEVAIGRWPQGARARRRRAMPLRRGVGPTKKIGPFPVDD